MSVPLTYKVGDSASLIRQSPSDSTTVVNQGSVPVYLATTQVTFGGFQLPPGASIAWGEPLYAYCDTGQSSTLAIIDGVGSYSDPAQIATQIIDQGLASQIASYVSASGAPNINLGEQISVNLVAPSSSAASSWLSIVSNLDVKRYQSLSIYSQLLDSHALSVPTNTVEITLRWQSEDGNVLAFDNYWLMNTDNVLNPAHAFISVPVRGPRVSIYQTDNGGGAFAGGAALILVVNGLTTSVPQLKYTQWSYYFGNGSTAPFTVSRAYPQGGHVWWQHTNLLGAGTAITEYPPSMSGSAWFTLQVFAPTNAGQFILSCMNGGRILAFSIPAGADFTYTARLYLPARPLTYGVTDLGGAGKQLRVAITYDLN